MTNEDTMTEAPATAQTVFEAFERTRRAYPQAPFLSIPADCPGGPQELTYGHAAAAVGEIAAWYRAAGYGRGHHVSLLLDSRVEFFVHWLALNAIGATLVAIGAEQVDEEVRWLLQFGEVDLLVCLPGRLESARRIARDMTRLSVIAVDSIDALLPAAPLPTGETVAADCAAIVFTSGSTGRPKGCMLSNAYFLAFGRWYRDLGGRCELRDGAERIITPLPPHHVNALAFSSMGAILSGGCIVQLDRFRSDRWWQTATESRATVMHYLGVMPGMLLKRPASALDRQHHLRFGFGGGVRFGDHAIFEERFGVPLIEAWAMTETGGAGTISTHVGPRHVGTGCIGQPSARYAEARIVDESGNTLPPESVGELVVRATGDDPRRGFFSGYFRDPAATASAWQGGWLHTGDLARRGEDGSIFFVGRRKQIIRRSGENIAAAEVEAVLTALPNVRQAAVVPVPDSLREEEVFACVVAGDGLAVGAAGAAALLRDAATRLSYFKLPGYIAFLPELPTTATQKLRYGAIIDIAQTLLRESAPTLFDVRDQKRSFRTVSGDPRSGADA